MSNQDIDGKVPPEAATGAPGTPSGAPETLEQQLAKEREARALMRDRLRTTEALAAESHALRARMAQELERVTADRDRLRTEAATATAPAPQAPGPQAPAARTGQARGVEPPLTPAAAPFKASHAADRPLKPPVTTGSKGPWGALAMLSVLAVAVAGVAWYKGSLPGGKEFRAATAAAAMAPTRLAAGDAASSTQALAAAAASRSALAVANARLSPGAVALPPLSPDAQLAAAPTAAGPAPAAAPSPPAAPATLPAADLSVRLRKALESEGIASPVDVDVTTGRVSVSDPQADAAQRQRTDMLIRAVYAGASLPEPQIEHRWLSPMRGGHEATASTGMPVAPSPLPAAAATAYPAGHAALSRAPEHRPATEVSVSDAEGLTPVLPSGRVTVGCMEGLAGRSAARRANLTACMKHSCCSSAANHNSEECRAYERAYPFTCGAG